MAKITNEVLAVKIDNLHTALIEMKGDVKKNSTFRLQFKGIIAAVAFVSTVSGGLIMALVDKIVTATETAF